MVLSAEELASRGSKQKGGASGTYAATQARQQAMMDATAANPVAYHPVGRTRQKKREHVPGFGQSCWADLSQSFCLFKQHLEFLLHSTPYPEDLERTAEWRFHEYGSHSPPPPKARSAAKELRKTERELKRATKSGDEAAVRQLEAKRAEAAAKAEVEAKAAAAAGGASSSTDGASKPAAAASASAASASAASASANTASAVLIAPLPSSPRELTPMQAAELLGPPVRASGGAPAPAAANGGGGASAEPAAGAAVAVAAAAPSTAAAEAAMVQKTQGEGRSAAAVSASAEDGPPTSTGAAQAVPELSPTSTPSAVPHAAAISRSRASASSADNCSTDDSTSDSDDDEDAELAAAHRQALQPHTEQQPQSDAETPSAFAAPREASGLADPAAQPKADAPGSTSGTGRGAAASARTPGRSPGSRPGSTRRSRATTPKGPYMPTPPKARRPRTIPRDDRPATFTQEVQPPPSARGPYAARRMGALPRDYATTDAYNDWVVGGANPEVRETAKSRQNQREAEGMPIPPPWIIQARRALYAQEEAQREAKQQQQKDAAAGSAGQQGVLTPVARKILQESAFRSSLRPRSPSAVPASTQPAEEADPSMPKPLAFDSDSDEDINPPGTSLARGGSGAQLSPAAGGAGDAAPALSQEALAALKAERAERRRAKSRALDARGREVEQRTLPAPQRLPRPSKTRARPRASQAELQA